MIKDGVIYLESRDDLKYAIRDIRMANDMNQRDFAEKIGVSQQLVSHLEQGKNVPSLTSLFNLSRALDCPIVIR